MDRSPPSSTAPAITSSEPSIAPGDAWWSTTVVDHHATPGAIDGSLDVIAGAVEEGGLRSILGCEATDRERLERAAAGIDETRPVLGRLGRWPRGRGVAATRA